MNKKVRMPSTCPFRCFSSRDDENFCKLGETGFHDDEHCPDWDIFPDHCPLRTEDITIRKVK